VSEVIRAGLIPVTCQPLCSTRAAIDADIWIAGSRTKQ
jgi:hypothetical protein